MSNNESSYSGRAVIISAIVGALAGAAAVLLVAPGARRESAARIRGLSRDLKDRATDTIDSAREKVASGVARSRDAIDEKRTVLASAVEAGKAAYAHRKAHAPADD